MADDLSATLAGIKDRAAVFAKLGPFSIDRTEAAGVAACPDCPADVYVSCAGCGPHVRMDSCPDRTRITAALTREEADRA
jgi:hypothetical protein